MSSARAKTWLDLEGDLHDLIRFADIANHFAIEICDAAEDGGADKRIVPARMLELLILSASVVQRECVAALAVYHEALVTHFNRKGAGDSPVSVDPIFAAIEEWNEAQAAKIAACGPREKNEGSAAHRRAVKRYGAAQDTFCACIPTTPRGLAAALAFTRDKARERQETVFLEDYDKLAPMFAASMATAAARLADGKGGAK